MKTLQVVKGIRLSPVDKFKESTVKMGFYFTSSSDAKADLAKCIRIYKKGVHAESFASMMRSDIFTVEKYLILCKAGIRFDPRRFPTHHLGRVAKELPLLPCPWSQDINRLHTLFFIEEFSKTTQEWRSYEEKEDLSTEKKEEDELVEEKETFAA